MKESDIDKKIAQKDKDWKDYTNMKIRVVKNDIEEVDDNIRAELRPFFWAKNNPGKAVLIVLIAFMISALAFHMIDIKGTIEKRLKIELKE